MEPEIPYTIGYQLDKAIFMLNDYEVIVDETSTVFQDKKDERTANSPVVVRQIKNGDIVRLTVARFK